MNKKNKHLDCYTDNLAFPEVHVEDVKLRVMKTKIIANQA